MSETGEIGIGKAKIGLGISVVLLIVSLIANAWLYTQITTLQSDYDDYKTSHSYSNSEYNDYVSSHSHSDSEYNSLQSEYNAVKDKREGTYEWNGSKTIFPPEGFGCSWMLTNTTRGFKTVTISIHASVPTGNPSKNVTVWVGFHRGDLSNWVDEFDVTASYLETLLCPPCVPNDTTKTYSITGPELWICFLNPSVPNGNVTVTISIYMTT